MQHCSASGSTPHCRRSWTRVRVDGIFVEMTELVQGPDGSTDVACEVGFARFGELGTFTSDEIPFSINNEADFRRINGIGGSVKVVGEINWCGRLGVGIIGCASMPGPRLAVVRFTPNQEAILWTHEFGHTTGSPHRDGPARSCSRSSAPTIAGSIRASAHD